jgi:hypothetical protein
MCVVASGNAFDGMTLYGPFDDYETAALYAEKHADDSWWIVRLEKPTED